MSNNSQKNQFFSEIYNKYIDKIYRFVYLKVSSETIAQDLTSETFTRFWYQIYLDKKIKNPSAFLYQIARNLVIDFYRKEGAVNLVPIEKCKEMSDPHANLEEKASVLSDMEVVRTALVNLKEDYQNVIIWRYLDDLSIPEIAKVMEKSEGTVRVTLHRALKTLRIAMNQG